MLKHYPTRPLASLLESDPEAPELIDQISNLMQRHKQPVPAAGLHLLIDEEYTAERILENAILDNDPEALKARIRWEVRDGTIGNPRFEDAAKLLLETLSQPELPAAMVDAGQEALKELWEATHDNPDVAVAFCWPFFTDDDHPYNRFVQQLFSIPRDLTLIPDEFIKKIHGIRPLLSEAKQSHEISHAQLEMLGHFEKLLGNLQTQYDQARISSFLSTRLFGWFRTV